MKSAQTKQDETKVTSKNTIAFVLCWLSAGHGLALKCHPYVQRDSTGGGRETNCFLCKQLSVGHTFCVSSRVHVHCPVSAGTPYGWTCVGCVTSHSLCEFVCASALLCGEHTASLVSSSPLVLPVFASPLLLSSLNLEGRSLIPTSHLGLSVSKVRGPLWAFHSLLPSCGSQASNSGWQVPLSHAPTHLPRSFFPTGDQKLKRTTQWRLKCRFLGLPLPPPPT